MLNTIDEGIKAVRQGKIVIVVDDENRENEGDFIVSGEKITPDIVNFMITHGRGLLCVPLPRSRCEELQLYPMSEDNTSLLGTPFTMSVDLKGYGYARVSKSDRGEFSQVITDYVFRSEKMHFLFVLVDSRLEPQAIDLRFIRLLGEHGIPFGIVFTKTDKLSRNQLESSAARYKKQLLTEWEELPPLFFASSAKRTGREEILAFIDKCLKDS